MIAARISGDRLHLQHGPMDLIIGASGDIEAAFAAAEARFATILDELVAELPVLRSAMPVHPRGCVARRMSAATSGYEAFITPMAAVAGSVADEVLGAIAKQDVSKAYVNNGGDIAVLLREGRFDVGIAALDASALGKLTLHAGDGVGGIATSGRAGRSLSLGIADSVTVLSDCAARADAAATMIANEVDVDADCVTRVPASSLDLDSDLQERLVVESCNDLTLNQIENALDEGAGYATKLLRKGWVKSAFLSLGGYNRVVGMKELADA